MILEENLSCYEFGNCKLDIPNHQLLKNNEPVMLAQKTFEILSYLVQNQGKILKKKELLSRFWGEEYVEEIQIAQQIYRIRKAIKDETTGENYIETIPKYGYRFIGEVKKQISSPSSIDESTSRNIDQNATNGTSNFELNRFSDPTGDFHDQIETAQRPNQPIADISEKPFLSNWRVAIGLLAILIVASIFGYRYFSTAPKGGLSNIRSIAVIPFEQIGGEKDEKLGLGLADSLISKFSGQSQMSVIPTSTIVKFIDEGNRNPLELGRKLEVEGILTGTIQRDQDIVRVNAQLVSTSAGLPIWADKFDVKFTDIFSLQDEISYRIARELPFDLPDNQNNSTNRVYTKNQKALQAYWMGIGFWSVHSSEGFQNAIKQFKRAVEIDPNFSVAYAYLADSYAHGSYLDNISGKEAQLKGRAAAKKALELDSQCPEALGALAFFDARDGKLTKALELMKRSVEIDPNHSHARERLSWMLADKGEIKNALKEARASRDLDPQSEQTNFFLARMLYLSRNYDEALKFADKTLQIEPNYNDLELLKFSIFMASERFDQAEKELKVLKKIFGENSPLLLTLQSYFYSKTGKTEHAEKLLKQVLATDTGNSFIDFYVGLAYSGLDKNEKAEEKISKTMKNFGTDLYRIKFSPLLDSLRKMPRFTEALALHETALGL